MHLLYLHPHDYSWISSTTYSNSQDYNVVFLVDRTTKNFQVYQSSTKPPQTQATKNCHELVFPLPSSLLQPSPKKVIESVEKHFGFILRHWQLCYLSPSYFEIKIVLFAFFPLKKSSIKP